MSAPEVPPISSRWTVVAAIMLNLVPIWGVLFWGWSAFALIFLYWLENVVIGVRTLASIFANAAISGGLNALGAVFFAAFFTLHYGLFCFVHGSFVLVLFGSGLEDGGSPFALADAARTMFARDPGLLIGFGSIVIWQIVVFALFIFSGAARRTNPLALMGAPYPRIIVLHLAIMAGGFLLVMFNEPLAGLVALALVKLAFDVAEALGRGPRFDRTPDDTRRPRDPRRGHPGSLSGPPTKR